MSNIRARIRSRAAASHSCAVLITTLLGAACGPGDALTEPEPDSPGALADLPARTDLGTLGGESSYAYDVNDQGVVVGASQTADGAFRGFRWSSLTACKRCPPSRATPRVARSR